jgi:LysM repeat protein
MGRATVGILIALGFTWAAAGEVVNPPPHPLHKVGDHWTPYEPPTEFPPDVQVYTIQPGDTLWDLAQKFYGNPYLWPQLWEPNTYIKDAHWIYPGDPLIVVPKPGEAAPAPPAPEPTGEAVPPAPAPAPMPEEAAAPPPVEGEGAPLVSIGAEDDVYCFAYLDDAGEDLPLKISGAEESESRYTYATGDIVYVSGGDAEGVAAGQEYFVVKPAEVLRHPATGARMGRVMLYQGHLRILCTSEHAATAELLSACDAMVIGDRLKPFEPIPIPMTVLTPPATRCDPPNDKPKGYIVYAKDGLEAFGEDQMVLIDLGEADQASPGVLCSIYRDNPAPDVPRLLLGELAILVAGDHWATAKVIRSSMPMAVGDRVEIK